MDRDTSVRFAVTSVIFALVFGMLFSVLAGHATWQMDGKWGKAEKAWLEEKEAIEWRNTVYRVIANPTSEDGTLAQRAVATDVRRLFFSFATPTVEAYRDSQTMLASDPYAAELETFGIAVSGRYADRFLAHIEEMRATGVAPVESFPPEPDPDDPDFAPYNAFREWLDEGKWIVFWIVFSACVTRFSCTTEHGEYTFPHEIVIGGKEDYPSRAIVLFLHLPAVLAGCALVGGMAVLKTGANLAVGLPSRARAAVRQILARLEDWRSPYASEIRDLRECAERLRRLEGAEAESTKETERALALVRGRHAAEQAAQRNERALRVREAEIAAIREKLNLLLASAETRGDREMLETAQNAASRLGRAKAQQDSG